ncbi:MAG: hypothetical protein JNL82_25420 [Myxococcales bacterium]|nr:hypothetical protein [Myxococcales bacterium]
MGVLAGCGDSGDSSATGTSTNITGASGPTGSPTSDPNPTSSATGGATESGAPETGGTEGQTGDSSGETGVVGTSGGSTGDGLKLDVGAGTGGTTGEAEVGCKKVDFLFIVDNSGSMGDEQQNLVNNFPGFIETIQDKLELASDYHIMVIDTDAYVFAGCELICPAFFNMCPMALGDYECGVTQPEMCEDVLGAGVIHPKGQGASGQNCDFTSTLRYMDVSEPDLSATFACAAKVGTGSTDDPEKPMQAMVSAIAPAGPAHDCNAGFLRDDAILVVTFITDEDDNAGDGSAGTVDGWHASLVAAKKGDESALVVLGLFGDQDKPGAICPPFNPDAATGAEPSPRLRQFVESFGDHGIAGSVCADSYKEFFTQAVDLIDSTCDGFMPPQ